jgi:hypothetical protein
MTTSMATNSTGVAMLLLGRMLLRTRSRLWVLGFMVCLAAVLVPAWLLEFRYQVVFLLDVGMRLIFCQATEHASGCNSILKAPLTGCLTEDEAA